MKTKIRVLHIDDNQFDRQLVKDTLMKEHSSFEVIEADSREKFEQHLAEKDFDLVLSDFNILGFDGLKVIQAVKDKHPDMPVIIVTGTGSEEIAIRSLKMGAADYVIKTVKHIRGLAPTIKHVLENKKDQDERRTARLDLQKSEEKYRKIFENVQDVFFQIDRQGIITDISPSIFRVGGYKREEIIGFPSVTFYNNPSERDALMDLIAKNGEVWDFEIQLKTKSGQIKYASLNAHTLMDEKNLPVGIEGSLRDVTERKQMETELIEAKKRAQESDRLKSAFLANMSHEIRTPMNGILGFAELLKIPDLSVEEKKQYISVIEKSGARMLSIINDIVDLSKIESGQMSVSISKTNVNEQIEFVYTLFNREVEQKGMRLFCKKALPLNEATIQTDREKLYAILANLVKNAIKYTDKGYIEFGYNLLEMPGTEALLQFYVKDTGIGIPPNKQEVIFERFIQANIVDKMARQGAGLGLAISKAYIEMLGGKIWVESREGFGSTFYFTLPYSTETDEMNDIKSKSLSKTLTNQIIPDVTGLKILIVEDDETSDKLISIVSQKFGKEIISVETGTEAVEACRKHSDIDLILMDIQLPEMDGYEATRQIRKFNTDVIIIAQTAYALSGDRERAIESGCNDYLSKPIKKDQLKEMVQKYFEKAANHSNK